METPNENISMEQALLAGLLFDKSLLNRYISTLKGNYFSKEFNRLTMDAILKLDEQQTPVDTYTVNNLVKAYGADEETASQILQWTDPKLSDVQFLAYSSVLKENYQRRELVAHGAFLVEKGLDPEIPVNELLIESEQTVIKLNTLNNKQYLKPMNEVIADFMDEVLVDANQTVSKNHSWFNDELELKLSGLRNGELIILGARPGMGKTSFLVTQLLHSLCTQKKKVAFVSMESDRDLITYRMLAQQLEIDIPSLLSKKITPEETLLLKNYANILADKPLHLLDNSEMTVFQMRHAIRQIQATQGLDMVIVDYLQLIHYGRHTYTREQEIAGIVQVLKHLARELDIPVLVSSQLSRASEKRGAASIPLLSDLRESGSIEQTADKVMFIYRPEYYGILEYEDGSSTEQMAEVHIAKNRLGPMGAARLRFNHELARFENLDGMSNGFLGYNVPHSRRDEFSVPPF